MGHLLRQLRQETNARLSVGTERLHTLRLHSRDNRELPSVPLSATSQRDSYRGVPDGPGPPCDALTAALPSPPSSPPSGADGRSRPNPGQL